VLGLTGSHSAMSKEKRKEREVFCPSDLPTNVRPPMRGAWVARMRVARRRLLHQIVKLSWRWRVTSSANWYMTKSSTPNGR
jgi:hypothetical protein